MKPVSTACGHSMASELEMTEIQIMAYDAYLKAYEAINGISWTKQAKQKAIVFALQY